jgi:hypothetical protein
MTKRQRRLTSRHFEQRNRERDSGYAPDLFRNPICVPVSYFVTQRCLWIVYTDGHTRTARPEEEWAWAEGTLHLTRLPGRPKPVPRWIYKV